MVTYADAIFGAIAGFIATWSISTAIAASELELGQQIGTFYSIIGIAIGFNNAVNSAYLGFWPSQNKWEHCGAIIGAVATKWKKTSLLNSYKGTLVGAGAGIAIWLILFLPITALLIQPSINHIVTILAVQTHQPIFSDNKNQSITSIVISIVISAIVFHMMWGAIFGFIVSSLLRIKVLQSPGIKE